MEIEPIKPEKKQIQETKKEPTKKYQTKIFG